MRSRDRFLALLAVILVIGAVKVAQQGYRYLVFSEERSEIVRLEREVEEAGLGVIDTHLLADSLRVAIENADEQLRTGRRDLDRLERQLGVGTVSRAAEFGYRERLAAYNERVAQRNELYRQWRAAVAGNHAHVERYNLLVDSIRKVASAMGEPYYPVLSPAELAIRREGEEGP